MEIISMLIKRYSGFFVNSIIYNTCGLDSDTALSYFTLLDSMWLIWYHLIRILPGSSKMLKMDTRCLVYKVIDVRNMPN